MSIKKVRFFLAFILIQLFSFGQNKTYVGVDFSASNDLFKITDSDNQLLNKPRVSGQYSILIRRDINRFLSIETGIMRKRLVQGIVFKMLPGTGYADNHNFNIIPLKVINKIKIYKENIFLSTMVGVNYYMCGKQDIGSHSGKIKHGKTDSISYEYTPQTGNKQNYTLIQLGLSVDFLILKKMILTIYSNRYFGYEKVLTLNIKYSYNNSPYYPAQIYTTGDFWNFGVGLRYPISGKKKDEQQKVKEK
jgi:hypothetical protein